jgi:Uma2 family endonuclease
MDSGGMLSAMTALAQRRDEPQQARVLLHGVSWDTYERLLAEHEESAGPRFTYDSGLLEIMTLSIEHEEPNRTLALLVELVLGEWERDFLLAGSNTFKRSDLAKGFEPDSCFYLRQPEKVRGKRRLDLALDPPPDLVLEIEVTRAALPRLPIFAAMGVPEVWRSDGEAVQILILKGSAYEDVPASEMLPGLSAETIGELLARSREMKGYAWMRQVREWAQAHRP